MKDKKIADLTLEIENLKINCEIERQAKVKAEKEREAKEKDLKLLAARLED